jgi:hypothetical protein
MNRTADDDVVALTAQADAWLGHLPKAVVGDDDEPEQ